MMFTDQSHVITLCNATEQPICGNKLYECRLTYTQRQRGHTTISSSTKVWKQNDCI